MCRVFQNAVHKLGGKLENILRSQNYIGKYAQKARDGALCEHIKSAFLVSLNQKVCDEHDYYTKAELADIHFIYNLTNRNRLGAV